MPADSHRWYNPQQSAHRPGIVVAVSPHEVGLVVAQHGVQKICRLRAVHFRIAVSKLDLKTCRIIGHIHQLLCGIHGIGGFEDALVSGQLVNGVVRDNAGNGDGAADGIGIFVSMPRSVSVLSMMDGDFKVLASNSLPFGSRPFSIPS